MASGVFHGTYDPAKVIATFDTIIFSGFIDGDFISAKFDEARYFKLKGTDGEVGRSRNPSRSGVIEVTLMSTSPVNGLMSDLFIPSGVSKVAPFTINDLRGNSLIFSAKSWVSSIPDFSRGMEVGEVKWTFDCAALDMYHGGTEDNSLASLIGI